MTRRRVYDPASGEPIALNDVIELLTDPQVLAPGHPARRLPCLVCQQAIGGAQVCVITMIAINAQLADCGSVPAVSFVVHAEHAMSFDQDFVTLMALRHQHTCREQGR